MWEGVSAKSGHGGQKLQENCGRLLWMAPWPVYRRDGRRSQIVDFSVKFQADRIDEPDKMNCLTSCAMLARVTRT